MSCAMGKHGAMGASLVLMLPKIRVFHQGMKTVRLGTDSDSEVECATVSFSCFGSPDKSPEGISRPLLVRPNKY